MEVANLQIMGQNMDHLVDELVSDLGGCLIHTSDDTIVLASEKYYFRLSSNLLTVVIIDSSVKDQYKITIISGGGASGLFRVTLGAQKNRNEKVVKLIEKVCAKKSWTIIKPFMPEEEE